MDEKWFGIRWDDYRNHILIVDARALPPERKVPALRSVQSTSSMQSDYPFRSYFRGGGTSSSALLVFMVTVLRVGPNSLPVLGVKWTLRYHKVLMLVPHRPSAYQSGGGRQEHLE